MSEVKAEKSKVAAKKSAETTATAKPKKAATAAKTTEKAVAAKPKKASAAAKAASPAAEKAATAKPAGEAKKKAPAAKKLVDKPSAPSQEERQRWIATAAYHRAEKRGFAPGYAMQDWFDAEAEINQLIGKA